MCRRPSELGSERRRDALCHSDIRGASKKNLTICSILKKGPLVHLDLGRSCCVAPQSVSGLDPLRTASCGARLLASQFLMLIDPARPQFRQNLSIFQHLRAVFSGFLETHFGASHCYICDICHRPPCATSIAAENSSFLIIFQHSGTDCGQIF